MWVDFLVGCTGCGKGRVGRLVAEQLGAEIISVDSMKVYRRMDIGTAKPSADDRGTVPHHMIDVVEPSENYSVARYVEAADRVIADIHARNRPIFAVGGTCLYIKSLSEGLFEGPGADPAIRESIRRRATEVGAAVLHAELAERDPAAAARIHPNDLRRIERALEVYELTGKPISAFQQQWEQNQQRYDCRFFGLRREKTDQSKRINRRVKVMIDRGLVDEVRNLLAEPAGMSDVARQAVGYAEIIRHLQGEITLDRAIEEIKIHSRHLAKSQRTWLKRWPKIHWIDIEEDDPPERTAARLYEEMKVRR